MRYRLRPVLFSLFAVALLSSGCGDGDNQPKRKPRGENAKTETESRAKKQGRVETPDEIMSKLYDEVDQMVQVLDGIRTRDDLAAARAQLSGVATRIKALNERSMEIGMPQMAIRERTALHARFRNRHNAIKNRLRNILPRVQRIPGGSAVLNDFQHALRTSGMNALGGG